MNKQRIRDIQGDTLIKRLGICGEQRFHCILRTDRTVYNQTSKENIFDAKERISYFYPILCWQQKLIP